MAAIKLFLIVDDILRIIIRNILIITKLVGRPFYMTDVFFNFYFVFI